MELNSIVPGQSGPELFLSLKYTLLHVQEMAREVRVEINGVLRL
jgi:hypothetical protein